MERHFNCCRGCCININEQRDGQRHDLWLPLKNIKTGRLHLAITVCNITGKVFPLIENHRLLFFFNVSGVFIS